MNKWFVVGGIVAVAAIWGIVGYLFATSGGSSPQKAKAVDSASTTTITWTPVPGTVGYQFLVNGRVVSSSNSTTITSTRFATSSCTSPNTCSVRALGNLHQWDTSFGGATSTTTTTTTTSTTTTTASTSTTTSTVQGGAVAANVFVSAAGGSCARSSTPVMFNPSQACSTFQAACDAALSGDTVGVEPGTYANVTLSNCFNSVSGPAITFRPDNGVVDFVGSDGSNWNSTALSLGAYASNPTYPPVHWLTFDGGPQKLFHTGSPTLPGHIYIGCCSYDASQSGPGDHITVENFVVCHLCPDPGGTQDIQVTFDTNVLIANNQIGPTCCGMTCNPTCLTSTTPNGSPTLINAGGGGEGMAQNITFTGNTLLGITDNAGGQWPAALGPPPQNACSDNNVCHDDCAHFNSPLTNLVVTDNTMYNCWAQGIFIEDDEGTGVVNGVTIENNYVGGGNSGIGALLNAKPDTGAQGRWIFAFNTSQQGVGMSREGTGPGFSLTVVGNYGVYAFHDDNGNNIGCNWAPQNGSYMQQYNTWYTSTFGNNQACNATEVLSPQTGLDVVNPNDWTQNDLGTNYDLVTGSPAVGVVPASVCQQYVSTDIHGKPRPTTGFCDAGAFQS